MFLTSWTSNRGHRKHGAENCQHQKLRLLARTPRKLDRLAPPSDPNLFARRETAGHMLGGRSIPAPSCVAPFKVETSRLRPCFATTPRAKKRTDCGNDAIIGAQTAVMWTWPR